MNVSLTLLSPKDVRLGHLGLLFHEWQCLSFPLPNGLFKILGDSLPPALATPAANKISERKCMRGPSIGSTNTNRNVIGSMISSGHKVDTPIKAGPNWASKNGSQTGAIRPAT